MKMITFTYNKERRVAVELEPDTRMINCLHCYQVQPTAGYRSFKVPKMQDIIHIHANPDQFPTLGQALEEYKQRQTRKKFDATTAIA